VWTKGDYTSLQFAYHVGIRYNRLPTVANPEVLEPVISGDFDGGLRFQTGAWDLDDPNADNAGVFWAQVKIGIHVLSNRTLGVAFDPAAKDPLNISVESGIEIKDRVTVKASWYKVLNNKGIATLTRDVVKVGFEFKPQG
jgi:hypothetical protein